jgi:hypothetical protein
MRVRAFGGYAGLFWRICIGENLEKSDRFVNGGGHGMVHDMAQRGLAVYKHKGVRSSRFSLLLMVHMVCFAKMPWLGGCRLLLVSRNM